MNIILEKRKMYLEHFFASFLCFKVLCMSINSFLPLSTDKMHVSISTKVQMQSLL